VCVSLCVSHSVGVSICVCISVGVCHSLSEWVSQC